MKKKNSDIILEKLDYLRKMLYNIKNDLYGVDNEDSSDDLSVLTKELKREIGKIYKLHSRAKKAHTLLGVGVSNKRGKLNL